MANNFYITTTLPYVNAEPHLGFAWEIVTADIIARYQHLQGKKVFFNTGTDEHGQKIYQRALENNLSPQEYTDELVTSFQDLHTLLGLHADEPENNFLSRFIRTTDKHHIKAAQKMWQRCFDNGDIYKKTYQTKYCVGCELEKTDSELVDGKCPLHPNQELEIRDEENYFFAFSKYGEKLLELYKARPDFVMGQGKLAEIESFVARGLQDFSISRVKTKMPWGIPVPGDDEQVMYVWFDALTNYISTLGWGSDDESLFNEFWNEDENSKHVQIAGKDNLRQQSAIWQAMLKSAGLPASSNILIDGFIMVEGQKMSKSLGNVISPKDLVEKYGVEATRFLLATFTVLGGDVDISFKSLHELYTAELVNGLGNLCSRVAKMAESEKMVFTDNNGENEGVISRRNVSYLLDYENYLNNYQTNKALEMVRNKISETDKYLSEKQPWLKEGDEKKDILMQAIADLHNIAHLLQPFMPQTAEKIAKHFANGQKIAAISEPLFPRISL